jgi:hypothetical protein
MLEGRLTGSASNLDEMTAVVVSHAAALRAPRGELKLMRRVWRRWHSFIVAASQSCSVPPEFLGALTANESGGDARAARFEATVYAHLKAVAEGRVVAFGAIHAGALTAELADMRRAKAGPFHAAFLDASFAAAHADDLAHAEDAALRELATSWGLTQIMGYHMVGRPGAARDLLEPAFHYRVALELLAEFATRYQLELAREFEEMFRCWNTGRPDGQTADPTYVEKGLRRMELYRALAPHG